MAQQSGQDSVVMVEGPSGFTDVVVLCEHASNHFPERFGTLGLSAANQISHAAWDPGALDLARLLAVDLKSPLVASGVSRLLYDCNRPPEAAGAMIEQSELIKVPGNVGLDRAAKQARIDEIYQPFCDAASRVIENSGAKAVVTMHTFTPVYHGKKREVEIGILHDADSRLADAVLALCDEYVAYIVRRNDPYGPEDGVTHSLNLHAGSRGLLNVMVEVRNDLVATKDGLAKVSTFLNEILIQALKDCGAIPNTEGQE